MIRAAVDLLGADHVLMGTDWPIVEEKSVPERLKEAFSHSGLSAAEQQMVASGNALEAVESSLAPPFPPSDMNRVEAGS